MPETSRITTYTARVFGETYRLRANFTLADSSIERECESGWTPTGRQVADYGHSPEAAMRDELWISVGASEDDFEGLRDEIGDAVASMEVN